jgi:hypothetical protein
MKTLVVVVTIALGAFACSESQAPSNIEQSLYECADPSQRFTCAEPANPDERFICHATGSKGGTFVKIAVDRTSQSHLPGVAHGNKPADQAPGASADDAGTALDCECAPRVCADTCTGAADGTACDDDDKCTTDGACSAGVCQPGAPRCADGTPVDACNAQTGACDAETGACFTDPEPAGTSCGDGSQCDVGGVCVAVTVVINEAESSGGVPGDWVELYNAGTTLAHVGGWRFLDADDTHVAYVIPAGTTIEPGAYLVLDEASFGFGLGGADSVRLFDSVGLVDSYAWTAHAVTTYGRCPNGTGAFRMTSSSTKGAANDCTPRIKVNEIESSGGVPGDWVELFNAGVINVDVGGWAFRDSDDTHNYVLPAGTTIAPGGYLVLDEATFGFGLGGADSARVFDASGALVDSHAWTAHAVTTYGRCPNGTGGFGTSTSSTKGAANDCSLRVVLNEVESNGGVPGDWVELFNGGPIAIDVSGWAFRDNDDTHNYVLPAGTSIAAGGYLLLEEAQFGFGLGGADSARVFDTSGALVDSHAWTVHAASTYGRCPNGTGPFGPTVSTKGAANDCGGTTPTGVPWPGANLVTALDVLTVGNVSGLVHDGSILWAVQNGPPNLWRIDGATATPTPLFYPGGATGEPDAEDVTIGGDGAFFVATERDNLVSNVSRPSILRFAPGSGTATHEWNLAASLPVLGPNVGLEAITFVPDGYLASISFYNPAIVPHDFGGLFFVGVEQTGTIHAYALQLAGGFTHVTSFPSGDLTSKALSFDVTTGYLWQHCGASCAGQTRVLALGAGGTVTTRKLFDRPSTMANLANEGIAIAPCVNNTRQFFWADDGATDSKALRVDTIPCGSFITP